MNFSLLLLASVACASIEARIADLGSTDPAVYRAAVDTLEACGPIAASALVSKLEHSDPTEHTTGTVAGILCRLQPTQPNVIKALTQFVSRTARDEGAPPATRKAVVWLLTNCIESGEAQQVLRWALTAEEPLLRQGAVQGIGRLGKGAQPLLNHLVRHLLTDSSPEVRCFAAEAIEELGTDAESTFGALVAAATDENEYVSECVIESIEILRRKGHRL